MIWLSDVLEDIAEDTNQVDGGIECDTCDAFYPIIDMDVQGRELQASCPQHGALSIDVTSDFDERFQDRIEDLPYQAADRSPHAA